MSTEICMYLKITGENIHDSKFQTTLHLIIILFTLQTSMVDNECDRNCSEETRTCMDNVRKCSLMKRRHTTYSNMNDTEFDSMVSESSSEFIKCLLSIMRKPGGTFITNALCIGYERPSRFINGLLHNKSSYECILGNMFHK